MNFVLQYLDIKMEAEAKLKEYQLKKYGKCFQCGEIVPKLCNIRCLNCGYEGLWEGIEVYQEDRHEKADA